MIQVKSLPQNFWMTKGNPFHSPANQLQENINVKRFANKEFDMQTSNNSRLANVNFG